MGIDGDLDGVGTDQTKTGPRLFFALWPSPPVRAAITDRVAMVTAGERGRTVPSANLHLTLAFLGVLAADRRACIEARMSAESLPEFSLVFDRVDYWRRSGIVSFTPSQDAPGLSLLVAALRRGSAACGLVQEVRPYRAHLTVMRKAHRSPRERRIEPMEWVVTEFCLVESRLGGESARYSVARRWALSS